MAADIPDYIVQRELGKNIELREYPSSLIAKVSVTGARADAANDAFRVLAGFIFGDNARSEKIAMTAPVTQIPQEGRYQESRHQENTDEGQQSWTVDFRMPSQYGRENLPAPENDLISIEELSSYRAIAIRFNGGWDVKNLQSHRQELDAALKQYPEIKIEGAPIYAFYNAPFVPKFMRRNEVMYRIGEY